MGLSQVGYSSSDIPSLYVILYGNLLLIYLLTKKNLNSVNGTLPQRRVLNLAPNFDPSFEQEARDDLSKILEDSLKY